MRDNQLPGGVAGVVRGDEMAWSAAVGFADLSARRLAEPDLLCSIASITKTVTGTAVMPLRDQGRLTLDDPVVAWLPELNAGVSPHGPIEAVTIRRMLSHESGLPAEPPGTHWAIPRYQAPPARRSAARARSPSSSRRTPSTNTPTWPTSCSARS